MDTTPTGDGRQHISLGPVERWVVSIGAVLIVAGGGWFARSMTTRLDDQSKTMQAVVTQQAVTNGQIQTLTTQLADVPRLTREMAEIKVRVDRHEQDIRDLGRR